MKTSTWPTSAPDEFGCFQQIVAHLGGMSRACLRHRPIHFTFHWHGICRAIRPKLDWCERASVRWLLLAVLCLLSGCLSRPHLQTQTLAFDPSTGSVPRGALRSQRVVSIRSLRVAAPFDDRSLVYRVGDFSYQADPYAEFLVSPAESMRVPIRSWMRQSDLFQTIVEPGSALRPNTMAEITMLQIYGDFRQPSEPAAVMTLRFVLLDSPEGIPGKLVFEQEYSRRVLLKGRNANALMAGWNEALNQILAQLGSDLRRLDSAPGS